MKKFLLSLLCVILLGLSFSSAESLLSGSKSCSPNDYCNVDLPYCFYGDYNVVYSSYDSYIFGLSTIGEGWTDLGFETISIPGTHALIDGACVLIFTPEENVEFNYDIVSVDPAPCMTSLQCETAYSLIPVSSVDSNYCENNNLCPVCSGSDWSALYINDIQHVSAGIIDISIPEEFDWNYNNTGDVFTLNISGYNTDSDYIAGIIQTQSYKPDSSDFTSVIRDLLPKFVPGLVIILFLYFVFRFLKKIF